IEERKESMATGKALDGKPYAGNPHVRFDEGEVAPAATPRRGSLLYKSWTSLGDVRPSYDEYERAMTRPVRLNKLGCVDAIELLDWVFREDACWECCRLKQFFSSLRMRRRGRTNIVSIIVSPLREVLHPSLMIGV
ncbi:MAG: hypothetical protein IJQ65_01355, partial [Kiritimatiellae bacterium]|nr:hypothetical protein [Kiritimatiellia bacterium]